MINTMLSSALRTRTLIPKTETRDRRARPVPSSVLTIVLALEFRYGCRNLVSAQTRDDCMCTWLGKWTTTMIACSQGSGHQRGATLG